MYEAVLAKFTQYADLRETLLATGDSTIVEHTENDIYWGDGGTVLSQCPLSEIGRPEPDSSFIDSPVPIQPARGSRSDVVRRMDSASRDQNFFSDRGVTDLPSDLEFHLALQHDDQFVCRVREILPSPTWRVDPKIATEPSLRPIGGNFFPVDGRHRECLQGSRIDGT